MKTGQLVMPRMLRTSVLTLSVAVAVRARTGIRGNLAACLTNEVMHLPDLQEISDADKNEI